MPYKDKEKQAAYWREYQRRPKRKDYKKAWDHANRGRMAELQRARVAADPEKHRTYYRYHRIKKEYGLTREQYEAMVMSQGGVCGICGKPPNKEWHGDRDLNVDHCHETGRVRGLLCNKCNRALGLVGDTVESVRRVMDYLSRFETKEA